MVQNSACIQAQQSKCWQYSQHFDISLCVVMWFINKSWDRLSHSTRSSAQNHATNLGLAVAVVYMNSFSKQLDNILNRYDASGWLITFLLLTMVGAGFDQDLVTSPRSQWGKNTTLPIVSLQFNDCCLILWYLMSVGDLGVSHWSTGFPCPNV